jgi:hypothetical protein
MLKIKSEDFNEISILCTIFYSSCHDPPVSEKIDEITRKTQVNKELVTFQVLTAASTKMAVF